MTGVKVHMLLRMRLGGLFLCRVASLLKDSEEISLLRHQSVSRDGEAVVNSVWVFFFSHLVQ